MRMRTESDGGGVVMSDPDVLGSVGKVFNRW